MDYSKGGTLFGATLLITGTIIGGGMLALPVLTATGGFLPAVLIYFLCWIFMACTGVLIMEIFLWSPTEINIVSMAKMTLGKPGKIIAWLLYLFLFYSLTVAYVSGGGALFVDLFKEIGWSETKPWIGPVVFILIFAPFVAIGAKATDRVNVILMAGLILSFIVFFVLGIQHVEFHLLKHMHFPSALLAIPVIFTSFGFQGTVPTLTNYLDRNPIQVRRAIFLGSAIPFFIYILWEALILGAVPLDQLETARQLGQTSVAPLKNILEFPWLYRVGEFFAFFALVTSFLGVTLGLLDFLADGLKIKKDFNGRILLSLLIYIPPLIFALINPCLFLNALHYGGGFGCALLLGLFPILMAWRGRYVLGYKIKHGLPGGRIVLIILILFILLELGVMISKF